MIQIKIQPKLHYDTVSPDIPKFPSPPFSIDLKHDSHLILATAFQWHWDPRYCEHPTGPDKIFHRNNNNLTEGGQATICWSAFSQWRGN